MTWIVVAGILIFVIGVAMATLTEGKHAFEAIISEAPGNRSRESVTVVSGAGELGPNTVLGKIKFGAVSETHAGNTGTGAMSALAKLATNCKAGVWTVKCIRVISNSGEFEVIDPDGDYRGTYLVGAAAAFANGITFAIADSTDFIVGDTFLVTVAAGSGKYDEFDPDSITGLQDPCAITLYDVDATSADAKVAVIVRDAELLADSIDWGSNAPDDNEKAAAKVKLAALGIICREAM